MSEEESSQTAELNSNHGDIDPGFGAGFGGFVITDQSPLAHQPAKGSFHDPAARQYFKSHSGIGAFDNLDLQLGAKSPDPSGERFTSIAAVYPQDAEPGEPAQDPAQHLLRAVAFGGAGRGHGHAEHQPQGIHQQMPLAPLDPLAGVIANTTAVTVGLDALAVENGSGGLRALVVGFPNERAQRVVEGRPLVVADPLPEDMINRFPSGKVDGQITPRAATLDDIQDGIQDTPPINGWASALGGFGEHWFEVSPLGIRETGFIYGVFHAPTEAALKIGRQTPNQMSTHPSIIRSLAIRKPSEPQHHSQKLIIQTDSNEKS